MTTTQNLQRAFRFDNATRSIHWAAERGGMVRAEYAIIQNLPGTPGVSGDCDARLQLSRTQHSTERANQNTRSLHGQFNAGRRVAQDTETAGETAVPDGNGMLTCARGSASLDRTESDSDCGAKQPENLSCQHDFNPHESDGQMQLAALCFIGSAMLACVALWKFLPVVWKWIGGML